MNSAVEHKAMKLLPIIASRSLYEPRTWESKIFWEKKKLFSSIKIHKFMNNQHEKWMYGGMYVTFKLLQLLPSTTINNFHGEVGREGESWCVCEFKNLFFKKDLIFRAHMYIHGFTPSLCVMSSYEKFH